MRGKCQMNNPFWGYSHQCSKWLLQFKSKSLGRQSVKPSVFIKRKLESLKQDQSRWSTRSHSIEIRLSVKGRIGNRGIESVEWYGNDENARNQGGNPENQGENTGNRGGNAAHIGGNTRNQGANEGKKRK